MKPNLDNIPLFADIASADRQEVADAMRLQRVRQGERIFGRGEGPDALYVIEIGWVKLLDEEGLVIANLGPGNLVGESEVLSGKPRELEAQAASDVSLWVLDAGDLDRLVAESLDMALILSKTFGSRIAQFTRYLVEERLKPIPFFFELDYEALGEVADTLGLERYQRGSFLFHRGGWARALFIIEAGQVNLIVSDASGTVDTIPLKPGDVVGDVALLTAKPYTFTAEVETDAIVWALGRDDFERLCTRYPSIRLILSRSMFMAPRVSDKSVALDYLRRIPLFAELSEDALKAVAQRLILRHVPQSELIYAEGSPGEAMYIIDSGEVAVVSSANQNHEVLAHLREGEYFGENSLLTGRSRNAAVRAVTNVNLWALYRSDFDELMVRFPSIRQSLSRTLERELSEAGRRFETIEGESSTVSTDKLDQVERSSAPGARPARPASPLGASVGRIAGTESRPSARSSSPSGAWRAVDRGTYSQQDKTQVFSEVGREPVEPQLIPSRYREEFLRPKPAESARTTSAARSTVEEKPARATGGRATSTAVSAREATRPQRRAADEDRERPASSGGGGILMAPVRLARWFAALTFHGKVRLLGLVLLFAWLCGITAPATALLWGVPSLGQWRIAILPDLFGGGQPTEEPQATELPAVEAQPTNPAVPTMTNTPVPTDTPVPSPTPLPTNTPVPPTDTPVPSPTPKPPTPTPDTSGTISSNLVWVRAGPGPNFKAVAKLTTDDKLTLVGRTEEGDWVQVKLPDGTQGWAEIKYIETKMKVQKLALVESPPTPTLKATEPPKPKPTETPAGTPTPAATQTPAIKYTAPVQTLPLDGWIWTNGKLAKNYLEWQSLNIAEDEFYNVTIIYKVNGTDQYFGDFAMEPRYLLPEALYLVADQHWYKWRVVVRKIGSKSADGRPDGPAISPESPEISFKWD